MLGRNCARRLGTNPGEGSGNRRGERAAFAAALVLGASFGNCGFPDYEFHLVSSGHGGATNAGGGGGRDDGNGGVGGGAAGGGAAGGGAAGRGGGGGNASVAGDAAGGEAASAGASGGPETECLFPSPVSYPAHCFNHRAGDGESGTDCGGMDCAPCSTNQACAGDSDCSSNQCAATKTCVQLVSLLYTPIDISASTPKPKFTLNLTYLDASTTSLSELTIRYYFRHNGVTEPVIGLDSQATIDPGNSQMDISSQMLTSAHRFPLGPKDQNGRSSDSYLEIAFNNPLTVTTGTKIVITQDIVAGSLSPSFDQNSHYSFMNTATANEAIVVYRAGQRIWGVEPPMALFPDCSFAFGVDLNGPALNVGGESLISEADAKITFSGGSTFADGMAKAFPTTDSSTADLLRTARTLNTGDSAVWPVPSGKYWAYAWLTSTASSDSGTLKIGDTAADKFFGVLNATGAHWALIGPYSVTAAGGALRLTVDGTVHVAGIKLYAAAP